MFWKTRYQIFNPPWFSSDFISVKHFVKNLLKALDLRLQWWDRQRETDRHLEGGLDMCVGEGGVIEGWGIFSGVLMVSLSLQRLAQMSGQLWTDLHHARSLYPLSVRVCACVRWFIFTQTSFKKNWIYYFLFMTIYDFFMENVFCFNPLTLCCGTLQWRWSHLGLIW